MANPSIFEDYFRRADLDQDGRISGKEAVTFFQGANLPQNILAKIWQFADEGQNGFLARPEFYNALKLVTVAQTGRELTPEIVRAALSGPAAAQIPAPRIDTPSPQHSTYAPTPAPAPSQAGPGSFPDQLSSGSGVQPRSWSAQPSALPVNNAGPPPPIPTPGSASGQHVQAGFASDTWSSARSSSGAPAPQQTPASVAPPVPSFQGGSTSAATKLQGRKDTPATQGIQTGPDNFFTDVGAPKPSSTSFTSSALVDAFGGDTFAATPNAIVPVPPKASLPQGFGDFAAAGFRAEPASMALVPTTVPSRDASKDVQTVGPPTRPAGPLSLASSGQGFGAPPPPPPPPPPGLGPPWPRMTASDTQRYTKVFVEVDTDRDGKISGEQARDLFLSWRLPREVLKQVWDLSDQDGDSMLSVQEFCTALYLMERYREGRALPPVLPSDLFDDSPGESYSSVSITRAEQPRTLLYNNSSGFNVHSWNHSAGALQPPGAGYGSGPRSVPPPPGDRPSSSQLPTTANSVGDSAVQFKSKAPVLEVNLVNQLSRDEQDTLKSRHKDAEEADRKAFELDKEIMDYREKAEFYRSKLQEIILFKSRCENRLGEITERAAADKREMESLAKKYDERFKAAGEVNSRLLAEEAAFRDIQERKIELHNAIVKIEEGGDSNGLLQSKADRISSDLDELKKALNERAKRLGLNVKSAAPTEQQFGWQPGLQENAAEWDEDWENFDDEGFMTVQDFMDDATGGNIDTSKPKPSATWDESSPFENGNDSASSPKSEHAVKVPKDHPSVPGTMASEHVFHRTESEGSERSGLESPTLEASTSSSQAPEKSTFDRPANTSKASQRYANMSESQEDVFNGPTSYSSTTTSFDQGPPSYNSFNDVFGDGGVSWSAAFNHDEEVDSGVRASWGLQSNPPSTQASLDVTGSRTSRFGRTGLSSSQGFGDSLDIGSMHVSSPGRVPDVSSPTQSHQGNGNFRVSEEYDGLGPLGSSKDFDRSPSFVGSHQNTQSGSTLFDSPRNSGAGNDQSFARFDSFASPQNNPGFPGITENRKDKSFFGADKDHNDPSLARFDSFSSAKTDVGRGVSGVFGSFDDGDDLFAGTGPFSAAGNDKKTTDHGWSAF